MLNKVNDFKGLEKNNSEFSMDIKDFYIEQLERENALLQQSITQLRREINRLTETPLLVCEVKSVNKDKAIIRIPNGNVFLVNMMKKLEGKIKPGDLVLVNDKYLSIVGLVPRSLNSTFNTQAYIITEKPNVSFKDVIGLDKQIEEIKDIIELPLKQPELFKELNIEVPKGVLLYGPPGTGKTLLAKAVANESNATFIYISASELVQKFIGEGAKLVKEIFELAREKAPSIVFIDEIDAIASNRADFGTGGEREVQRTLNQLLVELDGFKALDNVKVIAATNRVDILDPAILRPGRFDKIIEVPLPNEKAREELFRYYLNKSRYDRKEVDFKKLAEITEGFSGAEIKQIVTEAGIKAIKNKRSIIKMKDLEETINKIKERKMKIGLIGENKLIFSYA
jgi:proteasome regulatory subunit